jgi:hypothetical protein
MITNESFLESILDWSTDQGKEAIVLTSLLRKGWINEEGVVASDLKRLLDKSIEEAFAEEEFPIIEGSYD